MDQGPTTASVLHPNAEVQAEMEAQIARLRPRPLQSLVASAQRLTTEHMGSRVGFGKPQAWQDDGWEMFDLVGEQRFLTTTLANRVGQARFYVGRVPETPTDDPEPLDNDESLPARVFSYFGTTPSQRSQMVVRLACNLFVAGDGWFVGIPRWMMPGQRRPDIRPALEELTLEDLEWRMLSVSEVSHQRGEVTLRLGEDPSEQIKCSPDDVFLIRVWRPHPRKAWEADSPTRSSLPVLRELVGLTMHISAQVDSRLAGAGILIVPASAKRALQVAAGIPEDSDEDPFTEALIEAMITPIQDRASASAVVPLVVVVPDEAADKFQHITFDKPLDAEAQNLREEAIRRLALGQDAPPELLLGTAGMNHWGAWLVREDVVTTHIEPPLALICDAMTTQYLWPVLIESGMPEEEARSYVIWYDVSHMVQRPNRLADALTLHDKGAIGDETLREAGGFTDEDAPAKINRSVELAIEIAKTNPNLIDNLGDIIAAFDAILNPVGAERAADQAGVPQGDLAPGTTPNPADGQSKATGNPNPAAGARPARTARGTDTSVVDRTAETTSNPAGPPARPAGFAVHRDPYQECPEDCSYCAVNRSTSKATTGKIIKATRAGWAPLPPAAVTAAADPHVDDDTSVCIVAVPVDADDLPGPEDKHCTLVYLGHLLAELSGEELEEAKEAVLGVTGAVADLFAPVVAPVVGVGAIGLAHADGARVVFLDAGNPADSTLAALRSEVLGDPLVRRLYENGDFEKYPNFRAHVTLGYGDEVSETDIASADLLTSLEFDHLEVWWGNEHVAFPFRQGLRTPEEMDAAAVESAMAPGTMPADFLPAHPAGTPGYASDDEVGAAVFVDPQMRVVAKHPLSVEQAATELAGEVVPSVAPEQGKGRCTRCGKAIGDDEEMVAGKDGAQHVQCP